MNKGSITRMRYRLVFCVVQSTIDAPFTPWLLRAYNSAIDIASR